MRGGRTSKEGRAPADGKDADAHRDSLVQLCLQPNRSLSLCGRSSFCTMSGSPLLDTSSSLQKCPPAPVPPYFAETDVRSFFLGPRQLLETDFQNGLSMRDRTVPGTGRAYTSKVIKAGAVLAETKTLLAHWEVDLTETENLERIRRENLLGKSSRSRVDDILSIFRQRYLADESVTQALVLLVKQGLRSDVLDRLLYFHSVRSDRLLCDVVTEALVPAKEKHQLRIDVFDIHQLLRQWVEEGRSAGHWSDATIQRIAQGVLSTLRDFGVLRGAVNKEIEPAYLPIEAFAYLAFYLKQHQPSGERMIALKDWKLFFLTTAGVERRLVEAQQQGLLEFHAAGSVTRLTFPADSLQDYTNVLVARAH